MDQLDLRVSGSRPGFGAALRLHGAAPVRHRMPTLKLKFQLQLNLVLQTADLCDLDVPDIPDLI